MKEDEVVVRLHKPDSSEVMFFFICGVITSVPLTLFVAEYANSFLVGFSAFDATLISTAVFSPFIEEFSKAFPLFYRHGETERSIVSLAMYVGLGFGLVELLTYVFVLGVSPIIRLPLLFFHPASACVTAYGIAKKRPLPFYAIAVAFHFSNNFLALTSPFPLYISYAIVALTIFTSWQLYSKTKEKMVV